MSAVDHLLPPLLLSIRDTAHVLGLLERTVWSLVQERQLSHVRVGRRLLFSRASLEAWIAQQQIGGERRQAKSEPKPASTL
jgi:excisionase family DNA binding protein